MVGLPSIILASTIAYAYWPWFDSTFGITLGLLLNIITFFLVFTKTKGFLAELRE